MKTKSVFSIIFLGLLVFTSCNKDELIDNTPNEIASLNDRTTNLAQFSSREHFLSSIESFKNTGALSNEMNGIVSLSQTLQLKSAENETNEIDTLI